MLPSAAVDDPVRALFESVQRRPRPEDVAELVITAIGEELTRPQRRVVDKVARSSLRRVVQLFTSMAEDFRRPVAPTRQAAKACELFATASAHTLSAEECLDAERVWAFIELLSTEIMKVPGRNSFKVDRLNRANRKEFGLDHSRRRYNKLFRFLLRFERKLSTYRMEQRKYEASRLAKSGLATHIAWEDFKTSPDAAAFVAYYSARLNRRSVFTNKKQDRAFDEMSKMLLERFKAAPTERGWRAIAHVMPDVEVVSQLRDADKVNLLAAWMIALRDIADLLRSIWERSRFDRAQMIVKRGDDSSTWNALAGAWNASRQGWLGLCHALGMSEMVDDLCFGKVMRLMAADVAAWHRHSGGSVEPDTLVWAALPPPWEVFSGAATCTRADVEAACRAHNVDPDKKGWTSPRSERRAVAFRPTPELVHGVAVDHPELAVMLRKARWFSGKAVRPMANDTPPFTVHRDEFGSAVGVSAHDSKPD